MKKIIIICFLVASALSTFAQNSGIYQTADVEKVLATYKSEVKPYLQKMVDREYPDKNNDAMLLKESRLLELEAYLKLIDKDVFETLEVLTKKVESAPDRSLDSIAFIDATVDSAYKTYYTGLPYEFYKKASDKANGNL